MPPRNAQCVSESSDEEIGTARSRTAPGNSVPAVVPSRSGEMQQGKSQRLGIENDQMAAQGAQAAAVMSGNSSLVVQGWRSGKAAAPAQPALSHQPTCQRFEMGPQDAEPSPVKNKKMGRPRIPPHLKKPRKSRATGNPMGRPRKDVNTPAKPEAPKVASKKRKGDRSLGESDDSDLAEPEAKRARWATGRAGKLDESDDDVRAQPKAHEARSKKNNDNKYLEELEEQAPRGLQEYRRRNIIQISSDESDPDDSIRPHGKRGRVSFQAESAAAGSESETPVPTAVTESRLKRQQLGWISHKTSDSEDESHHLVYPEHRLMLLDSRRSAAKQKISLQTRSSRPVTPYAQLEMASEGEGFGSHGEQHEIERHDDLVPEQSDVEPTSLEEGPFIDEEYGDMQGGQVVTDDILAEHLQWSDDWGIPVKFHEFWKEDDEVLLLKSWSQEDEVMSHAFADEEIPLQFDMEHHWHLHLQDALPPGLHISVEDNERVGNGLRNRNVPASTCVLYHTCLLLPPFRDAFPFFQYMLKLAVSERLTGTPNAMEKPDVLDFPREAAKEPLARIGNVVRSFVPAIRKSPDADLDVLVNECLDSLALVLVREMQIWRPEAYEHLSMRQYMAVKSGHMSHDCGVIGYDFRILIHAWNAYAEKNGYRDADWFRRDGELRRDASNESSRTEFARCKKALVLYRRRTELVGRRRQRNDIAQKLEEIAKGSGQNIACRPGMATSPERASGESGETD